MRAGCCEEGEDKRNAMNGTRRGSGGGEDECRGVWRLIPKSRVEDLPMLCFDYSSLLFFSRMISQNLFWFCAVAEPEENHKGSNFFMTK